jgi:hypothetical protein
VAGLIVTSRKSSLRPFLSGRTSLSRTTFGRNRNLIFDHDHGFERTMRRVTSTFPYL